MSDAQWFEYLQAQLGWGDGWMVSLPLIAIALGAALALHQLLVRYAQQSIASARGNFWRPLIVRTVRQSRLALILLAISWAIRAAPIPHAYDGLVHHAHHGLVLVFLFVLGWSVITALDVGAALYLRRYRVDAPDDLLARKHLTQVRILKQVLGVLVAVLTVGVALMTFPGVRQLGVSLLAAGGVAAIIVGLSLQPILSNLLAGMQIALSQPIRIDDAVRINGEFGHVEEIKTTYVVIRLWDQRRLIVPLKVFLDQPFENWSRASSALAGSVTLLVDQRVPVDVLRARFMEVVEASSLWDRKTAALQVHAMHERSLEIRLLVSAADAGALEDLQAEVREAMVGFLQADFPETLPRNGVEFAEALTPARRQAAAKRIQ